MPFPGMFPTRWGIVFIRDRAGYGHPDRGTVTFRYVGKPNVQVAKQVIRQTGQYRGKLYMWEFDRGGMFRQCRLYSPAARLETKHFPLVQFYYAHSSLDFASFFSAWELPVYRKLVTYNKKKFVRYSPEAMTSLAGCREMKNWLDMSKFDLK